jgi:UDP-N-acetylglucosamine 2-epimerase (non-hydrolysing)
MKLLTIIGTRPEAVKMAPVLRELRGRPATTSLLCATGQHRALCDEPLAFFGLRADFHLHLMEQGQSLNQLMARALAELDDLLTAERPDRVIVHGDTTTALTAALAAFNRRIPVAHVEAGLRTYDPAQPWPEENNRRAIDLIADQLFAPTVRAARNLAEEKAGGTVTVTGNSGVDALHRVMERLAGDPALRRSSDSQLPETSGGRPLILATFHRRENMGAGVRGICAALLEIAGRGIADVALPVHPNPAVSEAVRTQLGGRPGIHLLPPLSQPAMVRMMQRCDLILTDSGGLQEEAPTLGRHVLVLREVTERPEAVNAGLAQLTGTCPARIVAGAEAALARIAATPVRQVVPNPYGDGRAASRIVAGLLGEEAEPFDIAPAALPTPAPLRLAG